MFCVQQRGLLRQRRTYDEAYELLREGREFGVWGMRDTT